MMVKSKLAPSTAGANVTHQGASVPEYLDKVTVVVNITAVGGTPTVTYKLQGSIDSGDVPDATSNWFDLMLLPSNADVAVATDTKTAVGSYAYSLAVGRTCLSKVRLVTSANTNVTYDADLATK